MREILFRGKRIDKDEWVYGDLVQSPAHCVIQIYEYDLCGNNFAVDPSTIGQYTGLTVTNGKKVFEGDIIKAKHTFHGSKSDFENKAIRNAYGKEIVEPSDDLFSDFCYYYRNYVVEYSEKKGAYIARNGSDQYYLMQLVKNHSAEIIGNTHDNPELLKDKPDD